MATETYGEGRVARGIEQQTKRVPSDIFLWAAFVAMGMSWLLRSRDRDVDSNFVGQWAPTLLILGVYNKIVKLLGSEGIPSGRRH